jgi:hypothetical protein
MKTFYGRYKGTGNMWHKIQANSVVEATGKMLKGTRYQYNDVTIKTTKPK